MNTLCIGWTLFSTLMDNLTSKITQDEFKPDIILAPQFGGWIPGRILKSKLRVKELANVRLDNLPALSSIVQDKNVLIVDDIADSGDTMISIFPFITGGAGKVKTATICKHKNCKIFIDYYVIENEDWVVFPWEENESAERDRDRKD